MYIKSVIINNEKTSINLIIADEFAKAFEAYNFKDIEEVNMVYQWATRCKEKGMYSWCPADTKRLEKYLGM